MKLEEYNKEITFKPAKLNGNADAWSLMKISHIQNVSQVFYRYENENANEEEKF